MARTGKFYRVSSDPQGSDRPAIEITPTIGKRGIGLMFTSSTRSTSP
jgi:hypothetical protein